MQRIIVAGSGTDVGKTVVSAILATTIQGDYWKPIQCGEGNTDSLQMKSYLDSSQHTIHPSAYSLKAPVSPHHGARLENININPDLIIPPQTDRPLIIEGVGGILVPLTLNTLTIDVFSKWNYPWFIVSRHYVGSINHTLLTIEALKQRHVTIAGIIFNGEPNPDSEAAILEISQLCLLGRLLPEKNINRQTIQRYATQWQSKISLFNP